MRPRLAQHRRAALDGEQKRERPDARAALRLSSQPLLRHVRQVVARGPALGEVLAAAKMPRRHDVVAVEDGGLSAELRATRERAVVAVDHERARGRAQVAAQQ